MQTLTEETRVTIALGWERSGLTQAEYAEQAGIAPRTLRAWLSRHASRQPPLAEARAALVDAIERLRALLAAIDAQAACQVERGASSSPAAGPACRPAAVREAVDAKDAAAGAASSTPVRPTLPDTTRHADLDALVAGVQEELAKGAKEPPASNAAMLPAPQPERRLRAGGFFATMDCE